MVSTKWRKSMFWLCRSCNRHTHSRTRTYLGCKSNQIRFEIWENRINGQSSSVSLSNKIDAELMRKIENFLQILNFKSVKTFLFSLKLWHKPFVPLQDNLLRQDSFQNGKSNFNNFDNFDLLSSLLLQKEIGGVRWCVYHHNYYS